MAYSDDERFGIHIGNLRSNVSYSVIRAKLIEFFKTIGIHVAKSDIDLRTAVKTKNVYGYVYLADDYEYHFILDFFKLRSNRHISELESIVKDGKALQVNPKRAQSKSPARTRSRSRQRGGKSRTQSLRKSRSISRTTSGESTSEWSDDSRSLNSLPEDNVTVKLPAFGEGRKQFISTKDKTVYVHGQIIGTENRVLEFKQGSGNYIRHTLKEHVGKYMVSFLNSQGGTLLIGVNDNGQVDGTQLNQKEEDSARLLIDEAIKGIRPEVFPQMYSVHFVPVQGGNKSNLKVMEIQIQEGHSTQLYEDIHGDVYIRRDGSVQGPLRASQIQEWTRMTLGQETKEIHTEIQTLRKKERELTELIKVKEQTEKDLKDKIYKMKRTHSQVCIII